MQGSWRATVAEPAQTRRDRVRQAPRNTLSCLPPLIRACSPACEQPAAGRLRLFRHELPLCPILGAPAAPDHERNAKSTRTSSAASTSAPSLAPTFRVQVVPELPTLGTTVPLIASSADQLPLGKWLKIKRLTPMVVQVSGWEVRQQWVH